MSEFEKAELTESKEKLLSFVEEEKSFIIEIAETIWGFAEISRQEYRSAAYLTERLEERGFSVVRGVGGYPTSFVAEYTYGIGGPVIGLLAEYDALPEIGHGCGHNLFAAAALGTAAVLKRTVEEIQAPVTIKVFGTPSEEEHGSKPYMVKQGIFDGVDCFMGFHPLEFNGVLFARHNGIVTKNYKFYGKSSHAGAEPHLGISALDAVELMNVAVNYLREHVTSDVRMHYIITHGGLRANVVPDFASSNYIIRAQEYDNLLDVSRRVDRIAEGIAFAISCKVEIEQEDFYSNTVLNRPYAEAAYANLLLVGAPRFTEEEQTRVKEMGMPNGLLEYIEPLPPQEGVYTASTDEGDVSWVGPWIRIATSCLADNTPGHSTLVTEQAHMSSGYKGMLQTVKVCSCTLLDVITDACLLRAMKADYEKRMDGKHYNREDRRFPNPAMFPDAPGVSWENGGLTVEPEKTRLLPAGKEKSLELKVFRGEDFAGSAFYSEKKQKYEIPLRDDIRGGDTLYIEYEDGGGRNFLGYFRVPE